MAITGAHVLLYSSEAAKLRAMLRDVLGWRHVDAGDGWLIFALPPAEIGVHPTEAPAHTGLHQFSLMCDDIGSTIRELRAKGVTVDGPPTDEGWGITTTLSLPGGVTVQLYEPQHPVAAKLAGGRAAPRRPSKASRARRTKKARP